MKNACLWLLSAIILQFSYGLTDPTSPKNSLYTLPLDQKIAVDRCHPLWGPSCSVENALCKPAGYPSTRSLFSSTASYACFCNSPIYKPAIQGQMAVDDSYGPAAVKCLPTAVVPQNMASCRQDSDCALIPHTKCVFNLQSFNNICVCDKTNGYDIVLINPDPEEITTHPLYRCTKKLPHSTTLTTTAVTPTTTAAATPPMTTDEHYQCQPGYTMLNGYCAANYGTECWISDCAPDTNFYCWASNTTDNQDPPRCFCRPYHMPERALLLGGRIVRCKASFGEPCWNFWDCGRPAMLCYKSGNRSMGTCVCKADEGWDNTKKACVPSKMRYPVMRYFRVSPFPDLQN